MIEHGFRLVAKQSLNFEHPSGESARLAFDAWFDEYIALLEGDVPDAHEGW